MRFTKMLEKPSERFVISFIVTVFMLVMGFGLSFVLPAVIVIPLIFTPGVLVFAFGGMIPRRHWTYGLNTNQRLAIERYRNADEETKKYFPEGWEQTVRNAKGLGIGSDTYKLAKAAEDIISSSRRYQKKMDTGDDAVVVALTVIRQNKELLDEMSSNV